MATDSFRNAHFQRQIRQEFERIGAQNVTLPFRHQRATDSDAAARGPFGAKWRGQQGVLRRVRNGS